LEKLNLFLLKRIIIICSYKKVLLKLWFVLIQGIAHIKNRFYNNFIKTSLYKYITKQKPNVSYIRILGSLVYTLIPKAKRGKFDNKANKGILVGFELSNNFKVYIL
jgi:hypothetical protein